MALDISEWKWLMKHLEEKSSCKESISRERKKIQGKPFNKVYLQSNLQERGIDEGDIEDIDIGQYEGDCYYKEHDWKVPEKEKVKHYKMLQNSRI